MNGMNKAYLYELQDRGKLGNDFLTTFRKMDMDDVTGFAITPKGDLVEILFMAHRDLADAILEYHKMYDDEELVKLSYSPDSPHKLFAEEAYVVDKLGYVIVHTGSTPFALAPKKLTKLMQRRVNYLKINMPELRIQYIDIDYDF